MNPFEYRRPKTLRETLRLLAAAKDGAKLLAGGTDLLIQLKERRTLPSLVVDIKAIPELQRLEHVSQRGLHLGAAVSLNRVLDYPLLAQHFPILAQACVQLGSLQIRSRASVGGNLCNASPAASTAPSLLCLKAQAVIAGPGGRRRILLEDFFQGPNQTALGKDELLVEVFVPTPSPSSRGCYLQLTQRQEMDIPMVNVACLLTLGRGGRCQQARVALGAVAPTPIRARRAEALLEGHALNSQAIQEAAEAAAKESSPIDDVRASAEYRREMVKVLTRRALQSCLEEAASP
ncbi:MAG: xanthine dehydrogenase family protein subunit M [Chloroflexi bacterium]|nr:xanthine dehydrogenase family protein subunit M [Chloroflexota bacterium]